MNANEVIESYVTDVAVQLPRKQRNDVAFELRALLHEELQAKAEGAGRAADAAMATELVHAMGRPAAVAARYRPPLVIIDPADGHAFLRAMLVGLAVIWGAGLLTLLAQPIESPGGWLGALGQWWAGAITSALTWAGMLVVGFGLAGRARRRRPQASDWKPRAGDRIHGGRMALGMGLVGVLAGLFVLLDPRWLLDLFWGGRAAPAAYTALTYTETFRQHQAPWLLGLLLLNVPLLVTVLIHGRWSELLRRLQAGLSLVTCGAMAWIALDGPVFVAPISDRTLKPLLGLIVAFTLLGFGIQLHRRVKATPNQRVPVER